MTIGMLLAGTAAGGLSYYFYPTSVTAPVADRLLHPGVFNAPDLASLLGHGEVSSYAPLPAPIVTATAAAKPPGKHRKPTPHPSTSAHPSGSVSAAPPNTSLTPLGGADHAGSLLLNATGSQLTSWNQTSEFCTEQSWEVPNGTVSTDSTGTALLTVNGSDGSCVGLISPGAYSSAVIEADIDFPALPGNPNTIADWTSFWLTNGAAWPQDGELDAVEAEPVDGVNATAWHGGTTDNPLWLSTDGFAQDGTLPKNGPNLTPGWHVVDIVYTKGFFAVYYDGKEFTSLTSDDVTGAALNIYLTTSVTPNIDSIQQQLGGPPVNSSSSPATLGVKYVKVWSYH
ncbi:MAG TPA: hypothetical protein VH594_12840 [Trebonia sp.]